MLYSSKIEAQRQNRFPAFNHRIVRIIKVGKALKDHQVQTSDAAGFMALFSDKQNMNFRVLYVICSMSIYLYVNGIYGRRE